MYFAGASFGKWLDITTEWKYQTVPAGYKLPEIQILFERLDKSVIEEERSKLKN